jgi:hypothetical protein
MNSHVGSWSPKWTPKISERNRRGQNPSPYKVLYIIGELLKHRCLKWARICPFGHMKHKLCSKERLKVKLAV